MSKNGETPAGMVAVKAYVSVGLYRRIKHTLRCYPDDDTSPLTTGHFLGELIDDGIDNRLDDLHEFTDDELSPYGVVNRE